MRSLAVAAILFLQSAASGADALQSVNWMRARSGLPPFQPDPALQQNAQATADYMARRNQSGHNGMYRRVAQAEGTGNRSGYDPTGRRFLACLTNSRQYRYAGAATAYAHGKTFYVLQLSNRGRSAASGVCPRCGRVHR